MGIDGIGGGAPPGAPGGPGGLRAPAGTGETFAVDATDRTEGVRETDALGKLEAGDISLDEYLDGRVDAAVQHLEGKISPEQLEFVRGELSNQLREDPVLVELVRRATGNVPTDSAE